MPALSCIFSARHVLAICILIVNFFDLASTANGVLQHVDPLIGTINGGHVFPGATLPFSMAKSVADVSSGEAQGGYASDDSDSKDGDHSPSMCIC